jgi:predicted RNase H-like HicB family nuclease
VREFSVLFKTDPELPGQWVAHCLNWDLVTQGNSLEHATKMIVEAIALTIEEDHAARLDPSQRASAPEEFWLEFRSILDKGDRLSKELVERLSRAKSARVAAVIYLEAVAGMARPSQPSQQRVEVPPPFMIAELQKQNFSAHT